jgi:hypothetical protein
MSNQIQSAWRLGRWWLVLALIVLGVLVTYYGLTPRSDQVAPVAQPADLFVLLAPFLALATAIERFWEGVFSWYESFAVATGRLVGLGGSTIQWMRDEASNAETAVKNLVEQLGEKKPEEPDYSGLSEQLRQAEVRLIDAQSRIEEALKAPEYVAIKRAVILLGSLVLGVIIGVTTHLRMMQVVGLAVGAPIDYLLSGLLIGAGPGPLHSLIGTLQELRNSLAGLADLARGKAIEKIAAPLATASVARMAPRRTDVKREATSDETALLTDRDPADVLRATRQARQALRPR